VLALMFGARAESAPLEVYGRLPAIEAAALSPDGAHVATIVTDGEARTIGVQRLSDGKVVAFMQAGEAKVRSLQWAGPEHLILLISTTATPVDVIARRGEYWMAHDLDVKAGRAQQLMRDVPPGVTMMNIVTGPPEVRIIDGHPFAFLGGFHFRQKRAQQGLFKIDLDRRKTTLVEPGDLYTRDFVLAADGSAVARVDYDPGVGRWALKVKRADGWRTVQRLEAAFEVPNLLGLGREAGAVLVGQQTDNRTVLREIALVDGSWGEPLAVDDGAEPLWLPGRFTLAGVRSLAGDEARYSFFAAADQTRWNAIAKAFRGDRVSLVSASDDGKKVLVLVDSPTLGPGYALVDMVTHKATYIGERYAGLKEGDVAPVRPLTFKARDGLELHGYLTLPFGREPRNLPLVVFPHGGPAVRDEPGFDWWAQAMASRGYAVLQVNYRGSDGYGWEFLKAGFGEWGRKMQTDLSDGVVALAAQGVVDPKRVCIVGGSYGGYAALAGATLDRGVYRCAASVGGLSDLRRFVRQQRGEHGRGAQRWWTRFMGAEDPGDPVLKAISPVEHAAKADAPVLLVHGRDDTVVPLEQSQLMASALKDAHKPVDLVILKGEDHWLSRGDTRLAMLQAVVAFLEKNNPPQ